MNDAVDKAQAIHFRVTVQIEGGAVAVGAMVTGSVCREVGVVEGGSGEVWVQVVVVRVSVHFVKLGHVSDIFLQNLQAILQSSCVL